MMHAWWGHGWGPMRSAACMHAAWSTPCKLHQACVSGAGPREADHRALDGCDARRRVCGRPPPPQCRPHARQKSPHPGALQPCKTSFATSKLPAAIPCSLAAAVRMQVMHVAHAPPACMTAMHDAIAAAAGGAWPCPGRDGAGVQGAAEGGPAPGTGTELRATTGQNPATWTGALSCLRLARAETGACKEGDRRVRAL